MVTAGILTYFSSTVRLIARNMAVNHGHDAVRTSMQRLYADLHEAASQYTLVDYNASTNTYSDVTPVITTGTDPYSGNQLVSTHALGVRYMRFGGGPFTILGDGSGNSPIVSTGTMLKFDFTINHSQTNLSSSAGYFTPKIGDKIQIPLLSGVSGEYDVLSVTMTAPTGGGTTVTGVVGISPPLGYTIYTTGTTPAGVVNPVTTGYFYQRVGYTVYKNQLRFHSYLPKPPYTPRTGDPAPIVVRNNITSPRPFALLFPSSTSAVDLTNLRVSLEAYDLSYSSKVYGNGTTTLQAIVPSLNNPLLTSQ